MIISYPLASKANIKKKISASLLNQFAGKYSKVYFKILFSFIWLLSLAEGTYLEVPSRCISLSSKNIWAPNAFKTSSFGDPPMKNACKPSFCYIFSDSSENITASASKAILICLVF